MGHYAGEMLSEEELRCKSKPEVEVENTFYAVIYRGSWMIETLAITKTEAIAKALDVACYNRTRWKWLYSAGYRVKKVKLTLEWVGK